MRWFCLFVCLFLSVFGLVLLSGYTGSLPVLVSDGSSNPETLLFPDDPRMTGFSGVSTAAWGFRRSWRTPGVVDVDSCFVGADQSFNAPGGLDMLIIYDQSAVVQIWGWY